MTETREPGFTARIPPGDPFCGACGHSFVGLTDSARCPECGRPIVEVLSREGKWGRRYESERRVLGLPLVHLALGKVPGEERGEARGWIAIGDRARGAFAFGTVSTGIVAVGSRSLGVVAIGGLSCGILSWGAISAGILVSGMIALGAITSGLVSLGWIASGALAFGWTTFAAAGRSVAGRVDERTFALLEWWYGDPGGVSPIFQPMFIVFGTAALAACVLAGVGAALSRAPKGPAA